MRPVDRPRRDQIPHQLLRIEAEDFGERGEPCFDQFMLSEAGHRFRLRTPEPAREHGEISGMLRPPDRNPRIRKQEREIGEIRSLVDPPTGLETQQDLYDVAESDVCGRCRPLAFRRRKHDVLQERKRHGEDYGIVLMSVAVGATD